MERFKSSNESGKKQIPLAPIATRAMLALGLAFTATGCGSGGGGGGSGSTGGGETPSATSAPSTPKTETPSTPSTSTTPNTSTTKAFTLTNTGSLITGSTFVARVNNCLGEVKQTASDTDNNGTTAFDLSSGNYCFEQTVAGTNNTTGQPNQVERKVISSVDSGTVSATSASTMVTELMKQGGLSQGDAEAKLIKALGITQADINSTPSKSETITKLHLLDMVSSVGVAAGIQASEMSRLIVNKISSDSSLVGNLLSEATIQSILSGSTVPQAAQIAISILSKHFASNSISPDDESPKRITEYYAQVQALQAAGTNSAEQTEAITNLTSPSKLSLSGKDIKAVVAVIDPSATLADQTRLIAIATSLGITPNTNFFQIVAEKGSSITTDDIEKATGTKVTGSLTELQDVASNLDIKQEIKYTGETNLNLPAGSEQTITINVTKTKGLTTLITSGSMTKSIKITGTGTNASGSSSVTYTGESYTNGDLYNFVGTIDWTIATGDTATTEVQTLGLSNDRTNVADIDKISLSVTVIGKLTQKTSIPDQKITTGSTSTTNLGSYFDNTAGASFNSDNLPSGFTIDSSTGVLTASKDVAAGSYAIIITVTQGANVISKTVNYTVENPNSTPIVAKSIPDLTVHNNASFEQTLPTDTFSDPDGNPLTITVSGLTSGMTFANGKLSGISTTNGAITLKVTATDTALTSITTDWVINTVNDAPALANFVLDMNAQNNVAFSQTISESVFTDPNGDPIEMTMTGPDWLTYTKETRTLSGTPTTIGSYTVTLTGTDSSGDTVSTSFKINVANDAPTVANTIPDQTCHKGIACSYTVPNTIFSDLNQDTLTLSASSLPAWLSFAPATGIFTGTPDTTGTFTVTLTGTDSSGASASTTINFIAVNDAPTVLNLVSAQTFSRNVAFSFQYASNVFGDVNTGDSSTITIDGGLTIDTSTRTISGTITTVGTHTFNLTATDGSGASVSTPITITIVNDAPTVANTIADQTCHKGIACSYTVPNTIFSDLNQDTLTLSASSLPSWKSFAPTTGVFTGTPDTTGTFPVTLTGTDSSGASASTTINFIAVNDAPTVLNLVSAQTFSRNVPFSFQYASNVFGDVNTGDSSTITIDGGLTINTSTRTISGTITTVGTHTFNLTSTDGSGASVSTPITITIVNDAPTALSSYTYPNDIGKDATSFNWVDANQALDVNSDSLVQTIQTQGNIGACSVVGNILTYTPNSNQTGSDTCVGLTSDGYTTVSTTYTFNGIDTQPLVDANNTSPDGAAQNTWTPGFFEVTGGNVARIVSCIMDQPGEIELQEGSEYTVLDNGTNGIGPVTLTTPTDHVAFRIRLQGVIGNGTTTNCTTEDDAGNQNNVSIYQDVL